MILLWITSLSKNFLGLITSKHKFYILLIKALFIVILLLPQSLSNKHFQACLDVLFLLTKFMIDAFSRQSHLAGRLFPSKAHD